MKKTDREIYIELASEVSATLCTWCKYGRCEGGSACEDGYYECDHPIEDLSAMNRWEDYVEPGDDCYGFRPDMPVYLIADIVGAIISQGWDQWFFRRYSKTSVTIYSWKNNPWVWAYTFRLKERLK